MTIWELLVLGIKAIQPFIVPICCGCAWLLMSLVIWDVWMGVRATVERAKQMHQIPCANCQFFTNDHRLKCTVHPHIANSENAIDCRDYQEIG